MTNLEKSIVRDEATILAEIALQICGSLKVVMDDAQWEVPLLAVGQPQRAMAVARTLEKTKQQLLSFRTAIEQWQRNARNPQCVQATPVSAFEAGRAKMVHNFLIVSEWERAALLDRAKQAGVPVQDYPVEPAKPSYATPAIPPAPPVLIYGTDAERNKARSLSALLAGTAAELCLELSCVEVSCVSQSFRCSCDLVVNWLGLAATLLNEMKAIPAAGYRSTQDEFAEKETKRLEKIRAQWEEFEQKVRWAEREQKNRLKAAPVKAPIVLDE